MKTLTFLASTFTSRETLKRGTRYALLSLTGALLTITQAQSMQSMDYVVNTGGAIYVVVNNQSAALEQDLTLTTGLIVLTNGVIQVTGDEEIQLGEGRKLTLDGFWMNDDGLLVQFPPHFMMKDNTLLFVEKGIFQPAAGDVVFQRGDALKSDGFVVTCDQRMFRLQDGQALTADGQILPALDHVTMSRGKLVLQKDGSIVPLPLVSTMGMSDGTRVKGDGTITSASGQEFTLQEGQRLVLAGAAMSPIEGR